jgi:hypothetical protein
MKGLIGLPFFANAFDIPSADFLAELGVPALKIGSGDSLNWPDSSAAPQADPRPDRKAEAHQHPRGQRKSDLPRDDGLGLPVDRNSRRHAAISKHHHAREGPALSKRTVFMTRSWPGRPGRVIHCPRDTAMQGSNQ